MYGILIASLLFIAFIGTLIYEGRSGTRLFDQYRKRLDRRVGQIAFILKHVDLASFVREELVHLAKRATHDLMHLSLQSVRAAERLLTQLVRRLRTHHPEVVQPSRESARHFVRTLSEFKGQLETGQVPGRPEMPKIR